MRQLARAVLIVCIACTNKDSVRPPIRQLSANAEQLSMRDSALAIVDALVFRQALFQRPIYAALCNVSDSLVKTADSLSAIMGRTNISIQHVCVHNENPNGRVGGDNLTLASVTASTDTARVQFTVVRTEASWSETIGVPRSGTVHWSNSWLTITGYGTF